MRMRRQNPIGRVDAVHDDGRGLKFKGGEAPLMRRVQGFHDLRLDGIGDLLHRARDASVFDIGCNRGLAGFEFAGNGATRVMGCDIYEDGIIAPGTCSATCGRSPHRFEVVDLTGGARCAAQGLRKGRGPQPRHRR
jgi:hypothetical protein